MHARDDGALPRCPLPEEELVDFDARAPSALAEEIDRGICEMAACELCGHEGLAYRPYVHRQTGGYRAFAECPACGHSEEM